MVKLYQNNSVVNAEKQNCGELSEDAPLLNSKRPPSQVSCFRVVGFLIFIAFLGLWGALGYYGEVATKEEIVVVHDESDQPTVYIQMRKFDERSVVSLPPRPSALVPDVKTTETGVSDTETLDDFLAVLNVATKIADITQAVEKLLPAIDLIGSVIELIFKFLPHESDYEKIVGQFNTVNEKLDALAYRMDQEADKILIAIDWATYKEQRQKILAVSESFNLMVLHINDTSFESEFVKTCDSIKVEQSLQYFEWEMNATHADSLVHLLTKEYHLKFFLLRSTDILSTATKAAFLLGACLRKQQLTENISNDLIQVYEGIAKEKVQSIVKSIYHRESFIKEGFMKYLTGEVNAKSEEAGYMANDVFASQLFDYVSDKYNWKRWFVASYNGNTFGFDNHAIFAGGDAIWQRHSNRHVMVATLSGSVKDSDRSWMKQTVSSCLSPHVFSAPDDWKDCLHLAKDLIPCLKNGHHGSGRAIPSFSMLACVRFGHGLRAVMHSEAPIFFQNIGTVKCNGGYAVVEKERVDCWRDFVGCQDWMYPKYPLNNDIDKCIGFFWNSRDYTADNSMIFLP